jgi:hypothetical protein
MSDRLLVADDYDGLRAILNERRMMLKMSMLQLDERAGLAAMGPSCCAERADLARYRCPLSSAL